MNLSAALTLLGVAFLLFGGAFALTKLFVNDPPQEPLTDSWRESMLRALEVEREAGHLSDEDYYADRARYERLPD